MLEITRLRGPCATLDVYGPALKREIKANDPPRRFGASADSMRACFAWNCPA